MPSPEERLTTALAGKTLQVSKGKYKCLLCDKCFKDVDYVHKHLKKVHRDFCDEVRQQVCADVAHDRHRVVQPR